jgi:SAM-dependent methyltransferase
MEALQCPDCGNAVSIGAEIVCTDCDRRITFNRPIDMRPNRTRRLTIELNTTTSSTPDHLLRTVRIGPPDVTYEGPQAQRDSRELISEMVKSIPAKSRVLDLGCGPRDQALPMDYLGYRYVGADYSNVAADLLVDAHSMPFSNGAFDCVFSYAVLEHLHSPVIALREIERVLRPGGIFIGTVSQGEPFHASYFHYTVWGLLSLAGSSATMRVSRLWCGPRTLRSLATMGRYPRAVKVLLNIVDQLDAFAPWLAPRRQRWPERKRQLDALYRAGSICFAMEKASNSVC